MAQKRDPFRYYARLRRVKQYVEAHLDERITLEDAARVAALEPKYFSRLFKKRVGAGFRSWLHSVRIQRAMELLADHDLDITTAASSVGYESLRTFQRAFRERTGITPKQFRQKARERSETR